MRLLSENADGSFSLTWFNSNRIPSYAILSHTWEVDNQEVTFKDLTNATGSNKTDYRKILDKMGYRKIRFCAEQAKTDSLQYFWVDSCSIDKSSSVELLEAINYMFRWYQNAAKCYVYLSGVSISKRSRSSPTPWELVFIHS
jgi:hypothetical protein